MSTKLQSADYMAEDTSIFIGSVGNDNYGRILLKEFESFNITPVVQIIDNGKSSVCAIIIADKERTLVPLLSSSAILTIEFANEKIEQILQADIFFVEGFYASVGIELVMMIANKFKSLNKKVAMSLSDIYMLKSRFEEVKRIADVSDYIFGDIEQGNLFNKMLGNETCMHEGILTKLNLLEGRALIITNGPNSTIAAVWNFENKTYKEYHEINPIQIEKDKIKDTNGCGDAFVGGFLFGVVNNKNLVDCVNFGHSVASIVLQNVGCTFDEIIES